MPRIVIILLVLCGSAACGTTAGPAGASAASGDKDAEVVTDANDASTGADATAQDAITATETLADMGGGADASATEVVIAKDAVNILEIVGDSVDAAVKDSAIEAIADSSDAGPTKCN